MGKTRRGGAWSDYLSYGNPLNWGKSIATIKADKCKAKQEALNKECGPGEASAAETPAVAQSSTEMSGAPPPPALGGRSRRRRQTRRKSKDGKHRRGH